MKKCLLLVALLIVSQIDLLYAQPLFTGPDTVCPKQTVQWKSNVTNASTHYWGFCSGYLMNTPVGVNSKVGETSGGPLAIKIARDKDKFYGFIINNILRTFVRLDYGNSLSNTPKITDYGDMSGILPEFPSTMHVVQDTADSTWHIFVAGGVNNTTASLARIDFGKDLGSVPNIVNFGNRNGIMDAPTGLFIAKEGKKWFGYFLNINNNQLVRMEFDSLLSYTPTLYNAGVMGGVSNANDMAPIYDNGKWYLFITCAQGNHIVRVDVGNTLSSIPFPIPVTDVGTLLGILNNPYGISIIRDCDSVYAFITNRGNQSLVRMEMHAVEGPYTGTNFGNVGAMIAPTGISSFLRDRDNLYAFTCNADTSITRFDVAQCRNTSITYSLSNQPPAYTYDTAGTYNVYYAINEGQPNMQVYCKLIRVLPTPALFVSPAADSTLCRGDTIVLQVFSANAQSYTWSPDYHISETNKSAVKVWPDYSLSYHVTMPFDHNCLIDTDIYIRVRKLTADAGPDRTISDGGNTILGGPLTSLGPEFLYQWVPAQYLDDQFSKNPVARPPFDFTYYLRIRDTSGCLNVDTVVVHVNCNDVNLPNAFTPMETTNTRFGLANQQVVKLNYFRIYDRWGNKVFDAGTDPSKEWDGKINGEYGQVGVYVWDVDGYCPSGKRLKRAGNVTLIR